MSKQELRQDQWRLQFLIEALSMVNLSLCIALISSKFEVVSSRFPTNRNTGPHSKASRCARGTN